MLKKILLLAAALLLTTAGVAHGQAYSDDDTITVSDTTVSPGDSITITARTYIAGSDVTFTLFSEPVVLGRVAADANGVATLTATIPADTSPGAHTIEATGTGVDGQPLTVRTTISVAGEAGAGAGAGAGRGGTGLPRTGSDGALSMTQVAIAAIAGGGLLVLVANKRRGRSVERDTVAA